MVELYRSTPKRLRTGTPQGPTSNITRENPKSVDIDRNRPLSTCTVTFWTGDPDWVGIDRLTENRLVRRRDSFKEVLFLPTSWVMRCCLDTLHLLHYYLHLYEIFVSVRNVSFFYYNKDLNSKIFRAGTGTR